MWLISKRRGRAELTLGVLHRRVEPCFRMIVTFRAVMMDRLVQVRSCPNRFMGSHLMHHLHMRTRETNNRFRCHEKQRPTSYHPTPTTRLHTKNLTRLTLGPSTHASFHG